jgi:hypothetical protein
MYQARRLNSHVSSQEIEQSCIKPGDSTVMYQARRLNSHVSSQEIEQSCIKPGDWTVMYQARRLNSHVSSQEIQQSCIASFYHFDIWFWNRTKTDDIVSHGLLIKISQQKNWSRKSFIITLNFIWLSVHKLINIILSNNCLREYILELL